MKLTGIHHVAIITSDYAASRDFYVNKLGFSILRENIRPEKHDVKLDLRVDETTELEIFGMENPPPRVTHPEACGLRHLAFHVDDIEAAVAELAAPVQRSFPPPQTRFSSPWAAIASARRHNILWMSSGLVSLLQFSPTRKAAGRNSTV